MSADFSFSGKSILIVEDQKPFQIMLKGMLKTMGADIIVSATSGEQAIVRCNEQEFDILFIDYNLGLGRNGRQLYEELKDRRLFPVNSISLIVTGESLSTMVIGALEVHPDDYIVKPFSQSLLKQRVAKIWERKQFLLPVLDCIYNKDLPQAIHLIDELIIEEPRFKTYSWKLKCDILYQQQDLAALDKFLDQVLKEKKLSWALIFKAKVLQETEQPSKAIAFAKEAISQNKFNVEAYDVLADCYLDYKDINTAYDWIQDGIEKSPFSVNRQYKLSLIAKLSEDYDASIKACKQVVEISSKGTKKDVRHMLNYIRNIIEICEVVDDQFKKNRYNQEVVYAIEESKQQNMSFQGITTEEFEALCMARLDSVNGQKYKAKKNFFTLTQKYHGKGKLLPAEMLVDSISLMLNIGEYDKAEEFTDQIRRSRVALDDFSQRQLEFGKDKSKDKIENVKNLNKMGIEAYEDRNYHKAFNLFGRALEIAPMNTSSAINQLQAIIDIAKTEPVNRWKFVDLGHQVVKIIDGVPLNKAYGKRAADLIEKLKELESQR